MDLSKFIFRDVPDKQDFQFIILFSAIITSLVLTFITLGIPLEVIVILGIGVIFIFFSIYFDFIFSISILLIFIYLKIGPLQTNTYFSFLLFFSLLLTHRNFSKEEIRTPYLKPFLILLLTMLPSLTNSIKPISSLIQFANFFSIIFMALAVFISVKTYQDALKIISIYSLGLIISSTHVILLGLTTGDRVFGFSEVFYIDLAGIGAIFSLILFMYSKGKIKFYMSLVFAFALLGLIFTQTRNAWISFLLTIFIFFIHQILSKQNFKVDKRKIIFYLFLILSSIITFYAIVKIASPGVESRIEMLAKSQKVTDNPVSIMGNSLLSRLLIWHTAFMAFLEHPFIGIGAYSFPFSSHLYYKIPKSFFDLYVSGLTPHHGYLGILTETGIVGFFGLIYFFFSLLKLTFKSIVNASTQTNYIVSLLSFFGLIYISISLFFTQAWFRGQQALLLGIIIGFAALSNKLEKKK